MQVSRVERPFGQSNLHLETGKLAKQAHGAVVVGYGDTLTLVTAVEGEAEAVQVLISIEQTVIGAANLKFQIAEAVERIGAPTRGNAAAVLLLTGRRPAGGAIPRGCRAAC